MLVIDSRDYWLIKNECSIFMPLDFVLLSQFCLLFVNWFAFIILITLTDNFLYLSELVFHSDYSINYSIFGYDIWWQFYQEGFHRENIFFMISCKTLHDLSIVFCFLSWFSFLRFKIYFGQQTLRRKLLNSLDCLDRVLTWWITSVVDQFSEN